MSNNVTRPDFWRRLLQVAALFKARTLLFTGFVLVVGGGGAAGEPGGSRRDLGIEGPGATPETVLFRWLNLGFFGFFLLVAAASAVTASIRLEMSALVLWPLCAGPAYALFACWRYFLPQEAWLEGTTLVVHDRTGTRRRNLATARDYAWGFTFGTRGLKREQSPPVLLVRQRGAWAVRFVLRNRNGGDLLSKDLRLLADAIESTSRSLELDPQAFLAARDLRVKADRGKRSPWPDRRD